MRDRRASRTAIVIAKAQALIGASREKTELSIDPAAEDFARRALEVSGHRAFVRALDFPICRRILRFYESLMIPGLAKHQVLRKQFIEREVRAALESGVRQVIQVGAGLDSLCHRLHRDWPEATFVEFDHPATQALKKELLDSLGVGRNLQLKPLDLTDPNPESFVSALDSGSSMIVAEGVLMYLPPELVTAWLQNWQRFGGVDSRLVFTFMEELGFQNQSRAVDWWLRLCGEPFRWHASRRSMDSLLRGVGWKFLSDHATWREAAGRGAAPGEWIGVAQRA